MKKLITLVIPFIFLVSCTITTNEVRWDYELDDSHWHELYDKATAELEDWKSKYQSLLDDYGKLEIELGETAADRDFCIEQIKALNEVLKQRDEDYNKLEEKYNLLIKERDDLKYEYQMLLDRYNDLLQRSEAYVSTHKIADEEYTRVVSEYRTKVEELNRQINDYKNQIDGLEDLIKELRSELDNDKLGTYENPVIIKAKMNGDSRNWIIGNTNINNLDLNNGRVKIGDYWFKFVEE